MNTYFLAKQFVECQVLNAQVLSLSGYDLVLLQGLLVQTLQEVQPTFFFGVPRYINLLFMDAILEVNQ